MASFEAQQKTLSGQLEMAKTNVIKLAEEGFGKLSPLLTPMVKGSNDFVTSMKNSKMPMTEAGGEIRGVSKAVSELKSIWADASGLMLMLERT